MHIAEVAKKSIVTELESSFNQKFKKLRSDCDVTKQIKEYVSQLPSVLKTLVINAFLKPPSALPRMKEIQRSMYLLPALFNDQLMINSLPRVVTGFLVTSVADEATYKNLEKNSIKIYSVMLILSQPNQKKCVKFASEVGNFYSKFPYSLFVSSLLALQNNSFNKFRNETLKERTLTPIDNLGADESSTVNPNSVSYTHLTLPTILLV